MKRRLRPLLLVLSLLVPVALMVPGWRTAAFQLAEPYTGSASVDGSFQLDLSVSPPVSTPGQLLTLQLRLRNVTGGEAAPLVTLTLPEGVGLEAGQMPAGITLNLQTEELNWLPVTSANGDLRQLELKLRVDSADILNPDQQISAGVEGSEGRLTASAPVWIGIAPQIADIFGPTQVSVGQPVQLRADILGSGPIHQTWDLGDGRRVDVGEPVVLYPSPGIYQLRLEAANPLTAVSVTKSVTVVPHPAAQFTMDDFTPGVSQKVNFLSLSGGQPPLAYAWDFGDGAVADSASPSHEYEVPGAYMVHLTVSNQYGASEAYWPVTVGVPPTADMAITDSVAAGEPLSGLAFGDDTVTLFTWDMGDGRTYEGEQVSHVYARPGDFYASLTAGNEFGSSEIGRWIQVVPGKPIVYLPYVVHAVPEGMDASEEVMADPFVLELEPVDLEAPFVMEPLELPEGASPSQQLFLYINEARSRFDLPPLTQVGELTQAAQQHTDDMARYAYSAHTGADGSFPAERLLRFRYPGGYAGEATAWGFQYPYQAVEFWINSPGHRRIILNRYASQVGVGFTLDYGAPNVWYWTAEFGAGGGSPIQPSLRLATPQAVDAAAVEADVGPRISDEVQYRWNWPLPLEGGQRFVLSLIVNGESHPIAILSQPLLDTSYGANVAAYPMTLDYQSESNVVEWQVRLESAERQVLAASERRPLLLVPDFTLPTPTPKATPTAPATAAPSPTSAPTVEPTGPPPTPRPTLPAPPILVTATPTG